MCKSASPGFCLHLTWTCLVTLPPLVGDGVQIRHPIGLVSTRLKSQASGQSAENSAHLPGEPETWPSWQGRFFKKHPNPRTALVPFGKAPRHCPHWWESHTTACTSSKAGSPPDRALGTLKTGDTCPSCAAGKGESVALALATPDRQHPHVAAC